MIRLIILTCLLVLAALPARAHEPMTAERMAEIATALDETSEAQGNLISLTVEGVPVLIVYDVAADRMRAITPIRSADGLDAAQMTRLLQANFDTALDARYSVANGKLWAAFIHPLSALGKEDLISGIGQVVNLALTYGGTYSSGALSFGGGDSRGLIEDLLKRGERI
ncbi:MAG: hypothetical protein AAF674_14065 [Pseudomonadota bacterium]